MTDEHLLLTSSSSLSSSLLSAAAAAVAATHVHSAWLEMNSLIGRFWAYCISIAKDVIRFFRVPSNTQWTNSARWRRKCRQRAKWHPGRYKNGIRKLYTYLATWANFRPILVVKCCFSVEWCISWEAMLLNAGVALQNHDLNTMC